MTGQWRPAGIGPLRDFLRDRLLEDGAEATAAGDTMHAAWERLQVAVRRLGVEIAATLRLTPLLQRAARRYETHPDYSQWWRP